MFQLFLDGKGESVWTHRSKNRLSRGVNLYWSYVTGELWNHLPGKFNIMIFTSSRREEQIQFICLNINRDNEKPKKADVEPPFNYNYYFYQQQNNLEKCLLLNTNNP